MKKLKNKLSDSFSDLDFNEASHTYSVKGRILPSVSSLLKKYSEPFDADKISFFVAKKRGISQQEVLDEWEEKRKLAIAQGNSAHKFGENYKPGISIANSAQQRAIVRFWDRIPDNIEPVGFELKMYSKKYNFAGTADLVLVNNDTGKLIICDYKTNKDLFKNYKGQKLLEPFGFLLDNPFNKYQIQLSFYQLLLEEAGFKVEARRVIWLKPNGTFKIYDAEDYTKLLLKRLNK